MARGWIQGWPEKFGEMLPTRAFPLKSKAAPRVESGGRFGGTLAANGRRLAEAVVELEMVSEDPVYFGKRPAVNLRYFPQLAGGGRAKPPVLRVGAIHPPAGPSAPRSGRERPISVSSRPDNELDVFQPREVRRGYRYSLTMAIDDLEVLEELDEVRGR